MPAAALLLAAASPADTLPAGDVASPPTRVVAADSIVVEKHARRLTLYYQGREVRSYGVALGRNPIGDKMSRGDGKTPEGVFRIESHNPQSKYHLALRISYPDATHRTLAAKRGVSPGGDIMIHGLPPAFASVGALHRQQDWTEGCIAVTNAEIEEISRAVPDGARIVIKP